MKAAQGVEMLELPAILANGPGVIHPTVIWDKNDVVLVDTGLPGQREQIRAAMEKAGIPFEQLSKVLITHSDMDHIGSLANIVHEAPLKVAVLAHAAEKPFIECEQPPIRLAQIEAGLAFLSGERRQEMMRLSENLKATYKSFQAKVDRTVDDNTELPEGGGIKVIHTPGHTLGHICLYLKPSKVLIAGDALQVADGELVPSPDFTLVDKAAAAESLAKLARYDIETVLCYHGGLYDNRVNRRIAELAGI